MGCAIGDCFQVVVDRDAAESEAPDLATAIHRWLIDEGIVLADPSDCVLDSDAGYQPGPHYEKATGMADEHLQTLRTNGLALITNRTVFHSGQGDLELICMLALTRIMRWTPFFVPENGLYL